MIMNGQLLQMLICNEVPFNTKMHLDHSKIISLNCYLHKMFYLYRILKLKLICDICNPSTVVNCAV